MSYEVFRTGKRTKHKRRNKWWRNDEIEQLTEKKNKNYEEKIKLKSIS